MLKDQGMHLWALEGGDRSEPIHQVSHETDDRPIVLVVGNEISGVDPGILDQCDKIISIPMQGIKTSLNTSVAFGIAVYTLRFLFK
jgi:tRNA G18 (ribose-2'-O)-methylase SpoU